MDKQVLQKWTLCQLAYAKNPKKLQSVTLKCQVLAVAESLKQIILKSVHIKTSRMCFKCQDMWIQLVRWMKVPLQMMMPIYTQTISHDMTTGQQIWTKSNLVQQIRMFMYVQSAFIVTMSLRPATTTDGAHCIITAEQHISRTMVYLHYTIAAQWDFLSCLFVFVTPHPHCTHPWITHTRCICETQCH